LDNSINVSILKIKGDCYVTHIQLDELAATRDENLKNKLLKIFEQVVTSEVLTESMVWDVSKWNKGKWSGDHVPTESFVLGVSRLNQSKLGNGGIYDQIKDELETLRSKKNNIQDSLIAETAMKNGYILVTDDKNLLTVINKIGGAAVTLQDFQKL
jgi:rRNA-processing protein FCF1